MQKKIQEFDELLDASGKVKNVGYSDKYALRYNKENIQKRNKIKEWDCYYVMDSQMAICVSILNLSYAKILFASALDLVSKKHYEKRSISIGKKHPIELSSNPENGTSQFETKNAQFTFHTKDGEVHVFGKFNKFFGKKEKSDLVFDLHISNKSKTCLTKVSTYNSQNQFCYSYKSNCLSAEGEFSYFGKTHKFDPQNSVAFIDTSRGVLPFMFKKYGASASFKTFDQIPVGFNLGFDPKDNSGVSENAIFYNGAVHKLEDVSIYIQKSKFGHDFMGTWTFYSSDGKLELIFEPILEHKSPLAILPMKNVSSQVFGRFFGKLILDDGKIIELENVLGIAEKVINLW